MKRLAVLAVTLGALITLIATGHPQADTVGYRVPDSIPADCSVDVAAALNAFIASVPDGGMAASEIQFKAGGCYRVEQSLLVTRRAFLKFAGQGATIESHDVDSSGHQPAWKVQFSRHIDFNAFVVRGDNPTPGKYWGPPFEYSAGWEFFGSHDVGVSGSEIHDVYGDGVTFTPGWDGSTPVNTYNGYFRSSLVEGNGRQCVTVSSGHDIVVEDSTFNECALSTFDLEPEFPQFPMDDITIRRNHSGDYGTVWLPNAGLCTPVRNIVVEANTMDVTGLTTWPPVSVLTPNGCPQRGPFTVRGNTFRMGGNLNYGPYGAQFIKGGAADVQIDGNTFIFNRASPDNALVQLENSHLVSIMNNVLEGADHLVRDLGGSDWTASGNRCGGSLPCQ